MARVTKLDDGWYVFWARHDWRESGRRWRWRQGPYRFKLVAWLQSVFLP